MKINLKKQSAQVAYIKSEIKVTVSLLVSNRIDTIRKCLDSIKPLLDAVSSELIVVDTVGEEKSDGSLAVAREYTDKIVHFDWCDDFAAARNAGLEQAKGEWFLYFDDDEWFEDVSEIVEFFTSGECDQYGRADYTVRNYTKKDGSEYSETPASRMARRTAGCRFLYPIHEYFYPMYDPRKSFSCFAHHYGYCYETMEEKKEHADRNISLLLQEKEKKPNDDHVLVQLAQEYEAIRDFEKAEECIRDALALNRIVVRVKNWFLAALPRILSKKKEYEKAEKEGERILKEESPNELARLNIFAALMDTYALHNKPEDALRWGEKYFEMLHFLDENPEIVAEQDLLSSRDYMLEDSRKNSLQNIVSFYQLLDRLDNLVDFFQKYSWQKKYLQENGKLLSEVVDAICKSGRYEALTELYTRMKTEENALLPECVAAFHRYLGVATQKEKQGLYQAAAAIDADDPIVWYCRAMAAAQTGGDTLEQALEDCAVHGVTCALPHQELLLVCLEGACNPAPILSPLYADEWVQAANGILKGKEPDELRHLLLCAEKVLRPADEIKHFYFSMRVQGLLVADESLFGEALWKQLSKWAQATLEYSRSLYHPNLFENIKALPRETRCALCLEKAQAEKEAGNTAQYLAWLRKALVDYPAMKPYVEELLKWVSEQLEKGDQEKNKEFEELAEKMKEQMRVLVWSGQTEQAAPILSQLLSLLPNDPELLELQSLCIE